MADILDFNDPPAAEKPISVALAYAARGWPVFPCNPIDKKPLTAHGFKDAETDPFKVRQWWSRWPNAMIGIPTGAATGFWVFDIDDGDGKFGVQSLDEMGHELAELTDTAVANTASGGYHCLFRFDPARPVSNARGALRRFLDVRGEGGYIIAAGSMRADGQRYTWLNPPDENEIADAPEWLYEAIRGRSEGFDFNGASPAPKAPAERVRAISAGTWHENTRDLVARMVREGASDETIAAIAPRFTEPGYSDAQTAAEFITHARTARAKWGHQPKDLEAAAQAQSERFKILSISELINVKPPEWRIDGVFPCHGASTLYGAYETFKTFIALDMTLCLATGRPWMGREVKPCSVLYIAGEGQVGLGIRAAGWLAHYGATDARFQALPEAVALPSVGDQDALLRAIDGMADHPAVIVLDTVTRMTGGGSLNDEKDAQAYVRGMDRLRTVTGAHILNIGHSGKDKERGILGSTVLPAAMETIICVERRGQALTLINANPKGKQKDGPNFEDIGLLTQVVDFEHRGQPLKTVVLGLDEHPAADAADADERPRAVPKDRKLGGNQADVLRFLKRSQGIPRKLTTIANHVGKSTSDTQKALLSLQGRGLVSAAGEPGELVWELTNEEGGY